MSATPERTPLSERLVPDPNFKIIRQYRFGEPERAELAELEQAVDEIDAAQTILEAGGSYAAFHVAVRDAVLRARQGVQHE